MPTKCPGCRSDIDELQTKLAGAIDFKAAVAGNWAGNAPTTTQDAINRLAAAVRGLLGAPIP